MAGDWIKFEATTPDKPEVVQMASLLGVDQDAVVGKLLRLWVWADQNSVDGNAVTVTDAFLDRLTFCSGFSAAMRAVGWLIGGDGKLTLPNFERHNGKTAKERAVSNRRVAKHRQSNAVGNADVTVDVTPEPLPKPLPEKRREEKKEQKQKITPPGTLLAELPEQLAADFAVLRKRKDAPITLTAMNGIRREAAKVGMNFEQAVTVCCERGWSGFKAEWLAEKPGFGKSSAPTGGFSRPGDL